MEEEKLFTDDEKKILLDLIDKKIGGIQWVIKNKDLQERKVAFLEDKVDKLNILMDKVENI